MPETSSADFWDLLLTSRLISRNQLARVQAAFSKSDTSRSEQTALTVAQWLVARRVLTRYQASVLLTGQTGPFFFGGYQVYHSLQNGRLSGMYRAVHGPTKHLVLLRFMTESLATGVTSWLDLQQWTDAARSLVHPQLQRVFAVEDLRRPSRNQIENMPESGTLPPVARETSAHGAGMARTDLLSRHRFLVIENLTGQPLEQMLAPQTPTKPAEACRLIRLAALALRALHDAGFVYGDLRPWNIWMEPDGNIKLLRDDPKLARAGDAAQADSKPGFSLEQADYMAPELTGREPSFSPGSDIYALGCALYQLLSGAPPFAGGDMALKLHRHATDRPASLAAEGIPAELADIVSSMLAKNVLDRPPSMKSVAKLVKPWVAEDDLAPAIPGDSRTLLAFLRLLPPSAADADSPEPAPPAPSALGPSPPDQSEPPPLPPTVPTTDVVPTPAIPEPAPRLKAGSHRSAAHRIQKIRAAQRRQVFLLVSAAAALLIATGVFLALRHAAQPTPVVQQSTSPIKQVKPAPTETTKPPAPDNTLPSNTTRGKSKLYNIATDDGQLLWMPPTHGQPIELSYVPPGVQLIMVLRLAALEKLEEFQRVLKALGPVAEQRLAQWQAVSGVSENQMEQVVFCLGDAGSEFPHLTCVIYLDSPVTEDALVKKWGHPPPVDYENKHYFQVENWTVFVPPQANGRVLVMSDTESIRDVIQWGPGPPVLPRAIARLLRGSDRDRHMTVLMVPDFVRGNLFRPGRSYYFGDAERLANAIQWLLPGNLKACLLSLQLGEPFYGELRAYGEVGQDSLPLAEGIRNRFSELPDTIEAYFARIYPAAYWRRIAFRVPEMIRFVHEHLRVGVEDQQIVANVVLPGHAAHNIFFVATMLLESPTSAPTAAATPQNKPSDLENIEQLLETRMGLQFDQKSLEFAIRDLATDVRDAHPKLAFPFDIKIMGTDLQLNGITRNQQIAGFSASDKTIAEILTSLVMKANPVTTVTQPSVADQKLVWVIGPDPDNPDKQIILITTRDAAKRNTYSLPPPFRLK